MSSIPSHVRVAIIGAGFSGLGTAINLDRRGIHDYVVLERRDDVGGTWYDNTYPGCACDIESHLYSFSFALNPDWSHRYSRQPEIWRYLQRCASEFGITDRIRFNCEVKNATWDESALHWRIETSRGSLTASIFVMATGPLSEPVVPDLSGCGNFKGTLFHSARWNHNVDLTGKRVAVIGTGASAIQFIPEIQPKVGKLYVFQRTAPWVIPRFDARISDRWRKLYRHLPFLQKLARNVIYAYHEATLFLFRHPRAMRRAQGIALWRMRRSIRDPELRAKVTPKFTMGCKRILLSNDYYPALAQPNVEVVTGSIGEVREQSIVGADGVERPVDVIIYGTGFRPNAPPLGHSIRGREGRTLDDAWRGRPHAHAGTTVAGFPNFFMLLGPNTGTGHTSVVYMSEAQIAHMMGAIAHMDRHGLRAVEPKAEVQTEYNDGVDRKTRGTVWVAGGCSSWYLDQGGRNFALWPDYTWRYRRRVSKFDPGEYASA